MKLLNMDGKTIGSLQIVRKEDNKKKPANCKVIPEEEEVCIGRDKGKEKTFVGDEDDDGYAETGNGKDEDEGTVYIVKGKRQVPITIEPGLKLKIGQRQVEVYIWFMIIFVSPHHLD